MNTSDITLKDIEYILTLAKLKSFSQAAEACSVSQPALSKQVKVVEQNLGVKLFERTKRQVLLTEAGQRFVSQAQIVMDEADRLIRLTVSEGKPLAGTFKLGVIASSCPYLLPYFVGQLKETFPELKLVIMEGLTENLVGQLKQGNLDAVIAATTFEDDQVLSKPLFFEPFLLAYSHKEANHFKSQIEVKDVQSENLLLLEDGHCLKDQTIELCSIKQSSASLAFKATSLETLLQMTAGGLGVSVIPSLAVPKASQLLEILGFSDFQDKKIGRTMCLFYRKSYPWPDNIQLLGKFIQAQLTGSPVKTLL